MSFRGCGVAVMFHPQSILLTQHAMLYSEIASLNVQEDCENRECNYMKTSGLGNVREYSDIPEFNAGV